MLEKTQLYAKIKKTSKYYRQNDWYDITPFPVLITGKPHDYGVHSDQNKYCLRDVDLFVVNDGVSTQIR